MSKFDETGHKYGKLTVVGRAENYKNGSAMWYCVCDCNPMKRLKVRATSLRTGHTTSCGCYVAEKTKNVHTAKILSENTREKIGKANRGTNINAMSSVGKAFPERGKYQRGSLMVRKVNGIIQNARKRNIEIGISKDQMADLMMAPCAYCGRMSELVGYKKTNGIDRVDNTKGYVEGNCVSCCVYCNSCKNDRTVDEFHNHVINMYTTMILKKN